MLSAKKTRHTRVLLIIFIGLLPISLKCVNGADLELQKKALDMISDFADRICSKIPLEGHSTDAQLSGQAKAELNNVLKQLAELGVQGSGQYKSQEYQGILQNDLAKAITESNDCRLTVFKELKDKFITSPDKTRSSDNNNQGLQVYNREATLRYWQNSFINKDAPSEFSSLVEAKDNLDSKDPRTWIEFSSKAKIAAHKINEAIDEQEHLSTKDVDRDLLTFIIKCTTFYKQLSIDLQNMSEMVRKIAYSLMNGQLPPPYMVNEVNRLINLGPKIDEDQLKLNEERALLKIKLIEKYGEGF